MNNCHAPRPVLEILSQLLAGWCFFIGPVKRQERYECCEVVLDPLVDLGEEDFFLFK